MAKRPRKGQAGSVSGSCRPGTELFLLFCYDPEHLWHHLSHPGIRALLARAGYDPAEESKELLDELAVRIGEHGAFPHEIGGGLFIGYPANDVAAFMGMVKLPFACKGPWKIR